MTEWLDPQQGHPDNKRYESMPYVRCGNTGLKFPRLTLGFWHNFGAVADQMNCRRIAYSAFAAGVTYFDLANNYGPPPGAAEESFGRILSGLPRDEVVISTKAGYYMWPGPYGDGGSRKYLLSSLDQSLRRLNVDYVDIFYHHRPDPDTPLEETLFALDHAVRSGKALYVGLSNYSAADTEKAVILARKLGTAVPIVNQSKLNLLDRSLDEALIQKAANLGLGLAAFAPLAQGLISGRYRNGIPPNSRAARVTWDQGDLKSAQVKPELVDLAVQLGAVAADRGQSLAQMAISWVLRARENGTGVDTVVVGVSDEDQLRENLGALQHLTFSNAELAAIDSIVKPFLLTRNRAQTGTVERRLAPIQN